MTLFLWLNLACAPHPDLSHAIKDPVVATPAPVAPVAPPAPAPVSFHAGNQSGNALIKSPVELWFKMLAGPIINPILTDDNHFYSTAAGTLTAFGKDGVKLWERKEIEAASASNAGVLATGKDRLWVLNGSTGEVYKELITEGIRGPAELLGSGIVWVSAKGTLVGPGWSVELNQTPAGHIAVDGTIAYVVTLEGEIIAVQDGTILWRADLPGPACSGPTLNSGHIYIPISAVDKEEGGVIAFNRDGSEAWRFRTGYQPGGALSVGEALWIADKDGDIYALNPDTGALNWKAEGFGEFRTQPVWTGRSLYAGSGDGRLYRIDMDDGGVAWSYSLGSPVTGDPVVVGDTLVVGTASGRLIGLASSY